jgi:Nif-specific regulatory protein
MKKGLVILGASLFSMTAFAQAPIKLANRVDSVSYLIGQNIGASILKDFSEDVREQLVNYSWPGNVNELKQAVEKAVLYNPKSHVICDLGTKSTPIIDLSKSSSLILENIPHADDSQLPLKDRVALVEREMILAEIKRHKGNKSKAAIAMGISREALRKKMLISDEIIEQLKAPETQKQEKKVA